MKGKCPLCGRDRELETTMEVKGSALPKDFGPFVVAVSSATPACARCLAKYAELSAMQFRLDCINGTPPREALADEKSR